MLFSFIAALAFYAAAPEVSAQDQEPAPLLWRQFFPGSGATRAMFISRSPQFVLYRNGLVIYRDDSTDKPYQQVQLSQDERSVLLSSLESVFRISALTPDRLKQETPYIRSVQRRMRGDNANNVAIWIGMYKPPSLHNYPIALLEARSGNTKMGPAWDALYRCNQYLSAFHHPGAKPLMPERIEIAVQPLPSYLSDAAASAVAWPLTDMALRDIQDTRGQGFRTITGEAARRAYQVLSEHDVVTDNGERYLVWARPLLLSDRTY